MSTHVNTIPKTDDGNEVYVYLFSSYTPASILSLSFA